MSNELKRPAGSFEGRIMVSPNDHKTTQIIITADSEVAKQLDEYLFSHGIISRVENHTDKKLRLKIDIK